MKRPVPQRWYLIGGLCFRDYFKSNFTLSIEILHEFAVVLTCHFQQGRTVEEKLSLLNLMIYDIRHTRTYQKDLIIRAVYWIQSDNLILSYQIISWQVINRPLFHNYSKLAYKSVNSNQKWFFFHLLIRCWMWAILTYKIH